MRTRSRKVVNTRLEIDSREKYSRKRQRVEDNSFNFVTSSHNIDDMTSLEMTEDNIAALMAGTLTIPDSILTSLQPASSPTITMMTSSSAKPSKSFPLLDFPLEILMLIVEYTLPIPHDTDVPYVTISTTCYCPILSSLLHREGQDCYHPPKPSTSLAIMRTNRILYHISRAHLYANTTLHITDKPRSKTTLPDPSCPAMQILSRQGADFIHFLRITLDLSLLLNPTWLHARLLLLKSQFPRLQNLTFEVHAGSPPPPRTPACLQVLADPALRHICRTVDISMCLGRSEHKWTFDTDVGYREPDDVKLAAQRRRLTTLAKRHGVTMAEDSDSMAEDSDREQLVRTKYDRSWREFCQEKGQSEQELLRRRLEFLPRWMLHLAEEEEEEEEEEKSRKRNLGKESRKEVVDLRDVKMAIELLEPVHTMELRKDWWWW